MLLFWRKDVILLANFHFTSFSNEDVDLMIESIDDCLGFIKPGMQINGMDVLSSFQSAKIILLTRGNHFGNPEISAVLTALQTKQNALLNLPSKIPFSKPDENLARCNRLVAEFEAAKGQR
jgi:hypothetical protein